MLHMNQNRCGDVMAVRLSLGSVELTCERAEGHDGPHQCGGITWQRCPPGDARGPLGTDLRPLTGQTYFPRGTADY